MGRVQRILAGIFLLGEVQVGAVAQQLQCPIFEEEPSCGKHEIGMNLYSWIHTNYAGHRGSDQFFVNGLFYRLHCGKNAWRAGVDLYPCHFAFGTSLGAGGNYPAGHSYQVGDVKDARFRIGYQRSFGIGKVKPFAGMDVGFRYLLEKYDFEGASDFVYDPSWGTIRMTRQQPFIAPVVGLNYRPTKHWSLTVEATIYAITSRTRTESSIRSFLTPEERAFSSFEAENGLLLEPLRMVALSYHL